MKYAIVGVGGTGGRLLRSLAMQVIAGDEITVIDGDKVEPHNLDRQFFTSESIGKFKTEESVAQLRSILQARGKDSVVVKEQPVFFRPGMFSSDSPDIVFSCVDNMNTRRELIVDAVSEGFTLYVAGNGETLDADAFVFKPEWAGTKRDPRKVWPNLFGPSAGIAEDEVKKDLRDSCTGEEAEDNTQLPLANDLAAVFTMHLFWMHEVEAQDREIDNFQLPLMNSCNWAKIITE